MYEVNVASISKTLNTKLEADDLITQLKGILGDVHYTISEITKTYDGKTSDAKEVGTIQKVIEQFPLTIVSVK